MQDPLSDIVHAVSITGGVFLEAHFTAPWSITSQVTAEDCAPFLDKPAQVIAYHVVTKGRLFLETKDTPPIKARAGEIILLPKNSRHILSSKPGITPADADDLILPGEESKLPKIHYGGGGEPTRIVCGFIASEVAQNPLIETLPKVIKLDIARGAAKEWIESSVQYAALELSKGQLASSAMMSRLSELLFVEAIRNYMENQGETLAGLLKGLRDPRIGRALTVIHRNVEKSWTANALASEVAMSRSAFVERFSTLVGMPPIRYLTASRLNLAKGHLRESNITVAEVAHKIGYDSAIAFNRAFKREFGIPPAKWRDLQ